MECVCNILFIIQFMEKKTRNIMYKSRVTHINIRYPYKVEAGQPINGSRMSKYVPHCNNKLFISNTANLPLVN